MKKSISYTLVATMLLMAGSVDNSAEAYTTSHDLRQLSRKRKIWNIPTSTNTPDKTHSKDLNMLKTNGAEPESSRKRGWKLSQAAVNSIDTTFASTQFSPRSNSLAHGLLSPEIVSRMDEVTEGGHHNKAVRQFLQTYRRQGPMSCLEMLSDPEVLPHLTSAMRDVV
jgi:hypothetical protein